MYVVQCTVYVVQFTLKTKRKPEFYREWNVNGLALSLVQNITLLRNDKCTIAKPPFTLYPHKLSVYIHIGEYVEYIE